MADQRYLIDSRFRKQQVPYPGLLSNLTECPEEFQPVVETEEYPDELRIYYHMFANERFVCGGYDEETLIYKMDLMFVYCKKKSRFFRIEYFTPKQDGDSEGRTTLRSFKCFK